MPQGKRIKISTTIVIKKNETTTSAVNDGLTQEDENAVGLAIAKIKPSLAQQAFLDCVGFG